ncbi:hypothetical protein NGRA_3029 [Nosema granulosis]|uniref:Uncharacterized protein n=1 Tax=Nosema granulosis TaxID=83296 RepID=A0A9P6GVH6_9MICR|nr:hypothetical protein NGRA_3029 [Nosema granulosis]
MLQHIPRSSNTLQRTKNCGLNFAGRRLIRQESLLLKNIERSIKHATNLSILSSTVLPGNSNVLKDMIVKRTGSKDMLIKEFVAANITLKKFRCPEIKELFTRWEKKTISDSSARSYILNHFVNKNFNDLKALLYNKKIFLVVDESEIKRTRYFIILDGLITDHHNTYVLYIIGISDTLKLDCNLVLVILIFVRKI